MTGNQRILLLISYDDSSLVIDKLCNEAVEGDPTVVCFYFDFAARNEQSPVNMLGSLLRQLVNGQEGVPEMVAREFRKEKMSIGGRGLQVSGILKMFQTITATRRTFICVDALDECMPEHRIVVLDSLAHILRESPNIRLFVTGRPQVRSEVQRKLDGMATLIMIRATEDGVLRFLCEKLKMDTIPDMMSSTLEADIMKSIPAMSSETYVGTRLIACYLKLRADTFESRFLLASLHIEAILRGTTVSRRRKTLKAIKNGVGLGDAYGATLERIRAQDEEKVKLATAALTWICYSERPLQVDELCHALAVEIGEGDFDPENVPSIGTLLDCCQGLVTVGSEGSIVRLIHHTVQEYLCSYPGLFIKPHSILAETCLTYLNSQQINNLTSHSLPYYGSMPFLKYSSRYWGTHTNKDLSDQAKTLALKLLNQYEAHISAVSLLEQELQPAYLGGITTPPLFSGLHCASFFGIVELVTILMNSEDSNVNKQDCRGRTPLTWAARNGHERVVGMLLERRDVDANRVDMYDRTPLGWAAMKGHEGVVKKLLEQENVDPHCPDKDGIGPLGWAANEGHEGVVKLLLEREDVDPNRQDKYDQTPLVCAAIGGHKGVVKILLEQENVDPNRPDEDGDGPLGCAAIRGDEGVVKLLLGRENVDPNRRNKKGRTPLVDAAYKGHEGVVKLLLERENVDPNRPDENNRSPLGCAASLGHDGVVKLLLKRENVDPNRQDKNDQTPLAWAAVKGHEGVVKLFLELENVDPNRPDKKAGEGPLGWAAFKGHDRVVKLLLEKENVDRNQPNMYDRTPLGTAATQGHERVVMLLLGQDNVDPNHPDEDGDGPLGCAAFYGHEGVLKLLLERENVDFNHQNKNCRTPLMCAAMKGHEGVVKLLLERENVDPNHPDENDRSPLGCAASLGHEGVVRLLLKRENVDPNRPDENDRTSLGWAAIKGHEGVVRLLLESKKVDPNRPDMHNRTPLQWAITKGHEGVAKLLRAWEDVNPNLNTDDLTPLK